MTTLPPPDPHPFDLDRNYEFPGATPFDRNIAQLSHLTTDRLNLSGHSLAIELAPSDILPLKSLDALATFLASPCSRNGPGPIQPVAVAAIKRPSHITIVYTSSGDVSEAASIISDTLASTPDLADVAVHLINRLKLNEKLRMTALKDFIAAIANYRRMLSGRPVRFKVFELRARNEVEESLHPEVRLAGFLAEMGVRKIELGVARGAGVCWLCEQWLSCLNDREGMTVRTWSYSGVCPGEWVFPPGAEDLKKRVEEKVVMYLEKARIMLLPPDSSGSSGDMGETTDEDTDEDEY